MAQVLFVLTSHDRLGDTGRETGYYFDEMAAPYWALSDAGHTVRFASIAGGKPPVDAASLPEDPDERPEPVTRFLADDDAMAALQRSTPIADIDAAGYDAVFLPGGHGTVFDFPGNPDLASLIGAVYADGGVVGAVCHGPSGLVDAVKPDGTPLVADLRVAGFTDAEEEAVGLTEVVPFLLESRLRKLGGRFEGVGNFEPHAVRDGRLVTGQNPASAGPVGALLVEALAEVATEAA